MIGLTRLVLRHRRIVTAAWLVIFLAGGWASSGISKRLSFDFSLPGQAGHETAVKLVKLYGNGGEMAPLVATLSVPAGQEASLQPAAARAFGAVQQATKQVRVVDRATTGDASFTTRDGRTSFALVYTPTPNGFGPGVLPIVQSALRKAAPPGTTGRVTGLDALAANGSNGSGPGVLLETLLGGLGALAVLVFVFASFLALVPLVIAAVSITATFLILTGITEFTDVSFIVQFLVSLIGLGVAIDYSLLIVTRWREERAHGRDNHDAIVAAMATAGSAVVFSGVTVAVGLFALVFLPVPFLRSIGYSGMLIPLVSVLVSITALPALLAGIGPRLDWPRIRHEDQASRSWSAWARLVVRRRWIAAGLATAALVLLLIPFFSLKIGLASSDSLAKTGPARAALTQLEQGGVSTGVLTPIEILVRGNGKPVADAVRAMPGIVAAYAPTGEASNRAGTTVVSAIPERETVTHDSVAVVKRVKGALAGNPSVIGVTGVGALQLDYAKAVYGNFPLMLGIILVLTYVLLARAFRSLLLPLKAVLLNLVSLAATFGAVVYFWQQGHGSQAIFGIAPTGAITFWLPLMVFAFLFGLSMDYEVFILTRVREEYEATGSTSAAVIEGLGRTGRLVTSAALILFLAFLSLSSGPETDIKVFATALGAGILLDATIIRAVLVPALVSLFGRWNWWLPAWAARPLRVAPSQAIRERPAVAERPEPVRTP
jgi:putative drug exporter of the RND superfamily